MHLVDASHHSHLCRDCCVIFVKYSVLIITHFNPTLMYLIFVTSLKLFSPTLVYCLCHFLLQSILALRIFEMLFVLVSINF